MAFAEPEKIAEGRRAMVLRLAEFGFDDGDAMIRECFPDLPE